MKIIGKIKPYIVPISITLVLSLILWLSLSRADAPLNQDDVTVILFFTSIFVFGTWWAIKKLTGKNDEK